MDKITWTDKDNTLPDTDPRKNWMVVDILELKTKFNDNIDEIEGEVLPLKANLNSPTFTGTVVLPAGTVTATHSPDDNSIRLATTAYVDAAKALKANIASPTFTGIPSGPTAAPGTNTTQFATTAFVDALRAAFLTTFVSNEILTGTKNGVNLVFTLANTPIAGSVELHNVIYMVPGVDYTIVGNTITFVIPPDTGSNPIANYRK